MVKKQIKEKSTALIIRERESLDQRISEWHKTLSQILIQVVPIDILMEIAEDKTFMELFPQAYLSVSEKTYLSGRYISSREGRLALWHERPQIYVDEKNDNSFKWDPKIGIIQSVYWSERPKYVTEYLNVLSREARFESWPGCQLYHLGSRLLKKED